MSGYNWTIPILLCGLQSARGVVLVDIIVEDPSTVILVGTGANSINDVPIAAFGAEIEFLEAFRFDTNFVVFDPVDGDLMGGSSNQIIDLISFGFDGDLRDGFSLGATFPEETTSFDSNVPAFTGAGTVRVEFSQFIGLGEPVSSIFQPIGSQGEIVVRGVEIGSWRVIPEPSSSLLVTLGLIVCLRRKRMA